MINFTLAGHGLYHWSFHYGHGEVEALLDELYNIQGEFTAPDLIDADVPMSAVGFGTIPCRVEGVDAVLYRWKSSDTREHGLVCLSTDREGRDHAFNKLKRKDMWA